MPALTEDDEKNLKTQAESNVKKTDYGDDQKNKNKRNTHKTKIGEREESDLYLT